MQDKPGDALISELSYQGTRKYINRSFNTASHKLLRDMLVHWNISNDIMTDNFF